MEWNIASVIPMPKTNRPVWIEKYIRPISLTPMADKVLEFIIMKWVEEAIEGKTVAKQFYGIDIIPLSDHMLPNLSLTEIK